MEFRLITPICSALDLQLVASEPFSSDGKLCRRHSYCIDSGKHEEENWCVWCCWSGACREQTMRCSIWFRRKRGVDEAMRPTFKIRDKRFSWKVNSFMSKISHAKWKCVYCKFAWKLAQIFTEICSSEKVPWKQSELFQPFWPSRLATNKLDLRRGQSGNKKFHQNVCLPPLGKW